MPLKRTAFFVSDRTGITAEMLGRNPSYLSVIEQAKAEDIRIAYAQNQRWGSVLI